MKLADLGGKRERAPARGVKDSDIPTQFSDSTRGGGNKDTPGSGEEKREQAPVEEVKVSDNPSVFLDEGAMDSSETLGAR